MVWDQTPMSHNIPCFSGHWADVMSKSMFLLGTLISYFSFLSYLQLSQGMHIIERQVASAYKGRDYLCGILFISEAIVGVSRTPRNI